jgi:hypothetical protein
MLAVLTAASIRSRIATGPEAGERWRRLGDRVEPIDGGEGGENGVESKAPIPPRCVREGGMSLHADVAVPAHDRNRLERLCRYVARPPIALDRLEAMPDGRLAYRLKTRWRDGTTHVVMERHELLERLAPLIPPPRTHQVRYHGVLAPCASGRGRVVPNRTERIEACSRAGPRTAIETDLGTQTTPMVDVERDARFTRASSGLTSDSVAADRNPARWRALPERRSVGGPKPILPRRLRWAELLKRVFEVDALCCPQCGGRMRVLSAITDLTVAARILRCLALPSRAPPLAIPRNGAGHSDSAAEVSFGEIPEFDFDQSQPSDECESSA